MIIKTTMIWRHLCNWNYERWAVTTRKHTCVIAVLTWVVLNNALCEYAKLRVYHTKCSQALSIVRHDVKWSNPTFQLSAICNKPWTDDQVPSKLGELEISIAQVRWVQEGGKQAKSCEFRFQVVAGYHISDTRVKTQKYYVYGTNGRNNTMT